MASQSAACTVVDILGEMMSAGFMFVSYDQTHNRSHLPGFETIMKAVCRDSAVCVQPLILALIGSLNCIVVIVQVFGFKKKNKTNFQPSVARQLCSTRFDFVPQVASVIGSCKIISHNAHINRPRKSALK